MEWNFHLCLVFWFSGRPFSVGGFVSPAQSQAALKLVSTRLVSQRHKCEIQNNCKVMCISTVEAELTVERSLCSYHTGNNLKASFPISLQLPNKLLGNFSSLPLNTVYKLNSYSIKYLLSSFGLFICPSDDLLSLGSRLPRLSECF